MTYGEPQLFGAGEQRVEGLSFVSGAAATGSYGNPLPHPATHSLHPHPHQPKQCVRYGGDAV